MDNTKNLNNYRNDLEACSADLIKLVDHNTSTKIKIFRSTKRSI